MTARSSSNVDAPKLYLNSHSFGGKRRGSEILNSANRPALGKACGMLGSRSQDTNIAESYSHIKSNNTLFASRRPFLTPIELNSPIKEVDSYLGTPMMQANSSRISLTSQTSLALASSPSSQKNEKMQRSATNKSGKFFCNSRQSQIATSKVLGKKRSLPILTMAKPSTSHNIQNEIAHHLPHGQPLKHVAALTSPRVKQIKHFRKNSFSNHDKQKQIMSIYSKSLATGVGLSSPMSNGTVKYSIVSPKARTNSESIPQLHLTSSYKKPNPFFQTKSSDPGKKAETLPDEHSIKRSWLSKAYVTKPKAKK